ncbi:MULTISPECIES: fused MFS/spermidine synthase [unclassified Sphingopyxis]|jgi:SAM-dependent methyltransferase|uniref:fused MFS/spermidine synthase n=1 Tax=unclassified Sphingopyxis TaxID=2614943 RepID=UPI0025D18121|nr:MULTISPECIES: fused MFS/spermidine synthase [unclassified Sphingopyxis]
MTALPRRWLFVLTILVGSFLLFQVQPMVARMVLPKLGGAPAVWNSAMLVYQALLLGGYAYAHWLGRFTVQRQAMIHVALFLVAALWLPIGIAQITPPGPGQEALWVPLLLLASIGPVFFVVSAQAPLMQRWFAADARAGDPYYLYAASNLGSFAGLISYPALVEPNLPLAAQSWGWTAGYALLVLLVAASAAARWHGRAADPASDAAVTDEPRPTWRRQLHWLLIAAVPSGLMLSTTTHLTTDIVAMPLLWVLPLGLYLLSFVIAFSTMNRLTEVFVFIAPTVLLTIGGLALLSSGGGSLLVALASLAMLFVVATALHGYLYHLRPAPQHLTLFYLIMSAGGVLGGLFAALLAPLLFDWVYEHPLLTLAAAMLLPLPVILPWDKWLKLSARTARLVVGLLVAVAAFASLRMVDGWSGRLDIDVGMWGFAILVIGVLVIGWRWAYVAVLALLMIGVGGWSTIQESLTGDRVRSYFGVYTVTDYPAQGQRRLAHGTTLHGLQRTDPAHRREATTYYGPQSGVGLTLARAEALAGPGASIGIVGLGAGTLACYRRPGQQWTFFEIDPVMVDIARDPSKFTFLSDCADDAPVVVGDARLQIAQQPPAQFDVVVIDAFSSDAIPLHLLTKEAIGIYARALKPDGILLIHISNRFFGLEPVLAEEARARGWTAAIRLDPGPATEGIDDLTASNWIALTATPGRMTQLTGGLRPRDKADEDDAWVALQSTPGFERWTDDYASTLPVLMWGSLIGKRDE